MATKRTMDLADIVDVNELLPWKVTDISLRPFPGMWSFNPSLHFDGTLWRCVLRCADYAMPNGISIRGANAKPACVQNKNVLLVLDPTAWRVVKMYPIHELDGYPRAEPCANIGFEDMRLFRTDSGGLQGIAASLHLGRSDNPEPASIGANRRAAAPGGRSRHKVVDRAEPAPARSTISNRPANGSHPPEQVLVSFDDDYNIVAAQPIRGSWSGTPQKNWSPFDGCDAPRFLYSIDRGIVFDDRGPIGDAAAAMLRTTDPRVRPKLGNHGVTEVKMIRRAATVSAGRTNPVGYDGIRGGSQLVHMGDAMASIVGETAGGTWLGIGHNMRFLVTGTKFYWHRFFLSDSSGRMLAISPTMKLQPDKGIEFAAGLAIDGDRVAISFGVDDMACKIGVTSLSAILDTLEPVE